MALSEALTSSAATWNDSWEVIFIDDGSTDDTWDLISQLSEHHRRWKGIRLSRNFGHQRAVSAGLNQARGDAVVVMDADLQDPPEVITDFLGKWREGFQVVYGVRRKRKEHFLMKLFYHAFYRFLRLLSHVDIPLDAGDFSLMDKSAVKAINSMPETHRYVRGMRAWIGMKQIGVEYERRARSAGETQYGLRELFRLAAVGVFSFSIMPLRLLWYTGLTTFGLSFTLATFYLVRRLINAEPVPGFASLIIVVLMLGGLQLAGLGLVGEYIGSIFEQVKQRPLWITTETLNIGSEDSES